MSRELALLEFQTLDGVMQSPRLAREDRSGGFEGGWATPYWDEVMAQVGQHAMSVPYDLLLGRKTYELFAASFPDEGDEHPLNRATKHVVTSSNDPLLWRNSVVLNGDVATEVARLKQSPGPLLQVHGSWQLAQALLEHRLVDELRLWTFPILAGGNGKRLFSAGHALGSMQLTRSATTSSGVVMGIYRCG